MFNKENISMNYTPNYPFVRSPLKDFPINTFNFIFSSQKKTEKKNLLFQKTEKKLNSIIKTQKKYTTEKKPKNIEITNEDLFSIFEALNNTLKKEKQKNNDENEKPNKLLNKKRKRKFITIDSINKKKQFINYKCKNILKGKNNKISVLTYNILNPVCVKKELMQDEISTDERIQKIKKEILQLSPDVFCLQEADIFIYKKYFNQNDMNKYDIHYGVNCGSSFINIIAYKKEKFILKSFKNFSLSQLGKYSGNRGIMNINLELKDNKNSNINKNNLDINDMIDILPKNLNKNKKIISIYNVHFPWKYENDRVILLDMLFRHIKENNIDKNQKNNILIMGDFNSEPNSKIIKLFYYDKFLKSETNNDAMTEKEKKVKIDLNNLRICEEIFNKFKFNSAYQNYSKEKIYDGEFMKHPAFTSRTKYFKKTIDYIFFSDNLKLRKILKLPNSYEVDKEKFLPSKEFPSDHLKLFAQFYM